MLLVLVISLVITFILAINLFVLSHRSKKRNEEQANVISEQERKFASIEEEFHILKKEIISLSQFEENTITSLERFFKNKLHSIESRSKRIQNVDIQLETKQLLLQTNNLLDLYSFERTGFKPELATGNLLELFKDVETDFELAIQTKRLKIHYRTTSASNTKMDSNLIKKVIVNLMDNAIRYSPVGGEIFISIDKKLGEPLTFHVENEGPAIPKKHFISIFNKYVKVGRFNVEDDFSLGIGLYLSKQIIELHQGDIGINSKGDSGVDFWVQIL